jgi:hypothetical protein
VVIHNINFIDIALSGGNSFDGSNQIRESHCRFERNVASVDQRSHVYRCGEACNMNAPRCLSSNEKDFCLLNKQACTKCAAYNSPYTCLDKRSSDDEFQPSCLDDTDELQFVGV